MGTFWDFCAPFYDFAEMTNGRAYGEMLKIVSGFIPKDMTVLEAAAGTGSISIAVSDKATAITCTDISEKMLNVARRKIARRGIQNITVEAQSIFHLEKPDNSFDAVIAGQVLHLVDEDHFGDTSHIQPVSCGVSELKIHYGAGYRIYYKKKRNNTIVLLLCAGSKGSQKRDIEKAIRLAGEN